MKEPKPQESSVDPKQQFNVYLPPELVKQLKHHCIERGGSLSNLVEQIFREYLARAGKEKKR